MHARLSETAPDGSWVTPFGSELHLRKPVEVLDPALTVKAQLHVVRAALDEVSSLAAFAETVLLPTK